MKTKRSNHLLAGLTLITAVISTSALQAAPLYKVNNSDNLNLPSSWTTVSGIQLSPPTSIGASDALYFNEVNMLGDKTLALGGNLTVGGLAVDYATTDTANNVTISVGGILTLNGTSLGGNGVPAATYTGAGIVLDRGTGGNLVIGADVNLGAAQQWVSGRATGGFTVNGAVSLGANNLSLNVALGTSTITGDINGSGKVTKLGAGTLTLPNANSFTGGFQLGTDLGSANSGVVLAGNANSLGTAAIVSRGTQLRSSVAGLVIPNNFTVGAGGFRLGGTNDFTLSGITTLDASSRSIVNYGTNTVTLGGIATVTSSVAAFDTVAGRIVVSGPITGAGGINISLGNIVLNGTNTYTGTSVMSGGRLSGTGKIPTLLTMSGGTLSLPGGATTGNALTLGAGATFTGTPAVAFDAAPVAASVYDVFNYTGTVTGLANLKSTFRGSFADAGTKVTFTLGAQNQARTWNGTTGSWDGTGAAANWLEGDLKFYNGDSATFPEPTAAATVTVSGTVTATGFAIANTTNAYTIAGGAITGSTGLVKSGAGTATLSSAANSFTGNVIVNGGTLVGSTSSGGTNSTLGLNSGSRSITVNPTGTFSLSTNNILGNNAQTLANTTKLIVSGGTVTTTNYNVIGDVDLNGGLLTATGGASPGYQSYEFNGSTVTVGGSTASTISATGANSGMHIAGTKTLTLNVGDVTSSPATDLTVSAALLNGSSDRAGSGSLVKTGAGTAVLSGANTYTGTTTVSGGKLSITGSTGQTAITVAGSTALDISGALGAGNYTGLITNNGAVTFANAADQTLAGSITGTGSLTKSGSGTLTLSNSFYDYSGPTTVTAGKLVVAGGSVSSSAITLTGGTLGGNGFVDMPVTVNGGGIDNGNASGQSLTLGNLTFGASGTIKVSNLTAYDAATNFFAPTTVTNTLTASGGAGSVVVNLPIAPLSAGTYHVIQANSLVGGIGKFVLGTGPALGSRQSGSLAYNAGGGFIDYVVTGANPVWTGVGSPLWTTDTNVKNWQVNSSPTEYIEGDSVLFDDTATGNFAITLNSTVTPAAVIFNNAANAYSISGTGTIAGASASIVKNGIGTVTLNTANTYGAGTIINEGVIIAGNASALGSGKVTLGPATLNLASLTFANNVASTGGTLAGGAFQMDGVISGTDLTLNASGIVKFSGVNTYTGSTTVVSGGLEIIGAGQFNSGDYSGAISNPVLFRYSSTADQTLRGAITGAGTLTKNGASILTLTGTQSYTGDTTINGGTLVLATPAAVKVGTNVININTGATLRIDSNNVLWNGGTGFTTLNIDGGTVNMNANHGHFGPLNLLNGATIRGIRTADSYNNEYSTFDADFTVGGNATSTIAGNDVTKGYNLNNAARAITVNPTGDASGVDLLVSGRFVGGGLVKNGTGVMKMTGNSNYGGATGNTTVNAGVLDLTAGQIYSGAYQGAPVLTINTGGVVKVNKFAYSETVGSTSSLGALRDYGSARVINGGTLEVRGSTESSGNNFNIGANGGTFRYSPAVTTDTLSLTGNGNSNINIAGALTFDTVGNITVTELVEGAGSLTKTGTGTLTLSAVNTRTGATTVTAGVLAVTGTALADASSLTITGGKVNLTGTETVNALFFGAAQQASGTWGATGSGATHIDDIHFSGPGKLSVTTGPVGGYSTWAATNASTGGANDDYDNDGVSNGVEYVLGGSAATNDAGKLPTISVTGGNLVFTFVRKQASDTPDATTAIEVGTNLATWPQTFTVGTSPEVSVTPNGNGTDTVTLTLGQAADPKKFARLTVSIAN